MATIENGLLLNNNRVFLPSENINVFPCSRRGQNATSEKYYDPEARLNTERTNRLVTAANGFTDSFVSDFSKDTAADGSSLVTGSLIFTLAGYRVEAKNVNPEKIAELLKVGDTGIIYAYLGLHGGISLNTAEYFTEILYRQSNKLVDKNYLDVHYEDDINNNIQDDFFVGISFTANKNTSDTGITPRTLPIFSKVGNTWELVEASKLPKVEHDTEPDSIKLSGNFTVKHGEQPSFQVTKDKTILGQTDIIGDFTVKRISDEGEQISFEITKQGVGTANVPLHITKATAIDGHANFNAGVSALSLIVGDTAEEDIFPKGTIKAKEHIETPTLEVSTITSNSAAGIVVDQNLTISDSTLTVTGDTQLQTVTVNGLIDNQSTQLSQLQVSGNATVNGLTKANEIDAAKITANELWLDAVDNDPIGQVPALELAHLTKTDTYQLRFKFGKQPITIIEE